MAGGRSIGAIRRHHRGDLWPQYVAYDTANNRVGSLDAAPADKGGFWKLLFGTWIRSNGHIAATSSASVGIAQLGDCLNGSITAGIMSQDWHFDGHGLVFRLQDKDNYLVMLPTDPSNTGAGNLKIISNIAGVKTELASGSCTLGNSATNESFRVTFDNTQVQAFGLVISNLVLKTTYILAGAAAALTGTGCGLQAPGQPQGESRNWVDEYTVVIDPYPEYLAYDDFDHADSSGLGVAKKGGTWGYSTAGVDTTGTTRWKVVGGQCVANSNEANPLAWLEIGTGDFTMQTDMLAFNGPVFRMQDGANYWELQSNGATIRLISMAASAVTVNASVANTAGFHVLKVDARGTAINCFRDGSNIISFTSSLYQTATRVGLAGAFGNGDKFDNFWVKP